MDELDDALREFLAESHENLDAMDQDLIALGERPGDREAVDRIFRTVHTIKGTCGFLALDGLAEVAHAGESLLCGLRDGGVAWGPDVTDVLLALSAAVRRLLGEVAAGGGGTAAEHAALVARLGRLAGGPGDPVSGPPEDTPADPRPAALDTGPPVEPPREESHAPTGGGTIRVDVGLLDRLMNLVGELVLARNQILQHSAIRQDSALLGTSQRLNLITTELQEGVMKTRMQPIGHVWTKMPRLVRDLARACGKQATVETHGHETELDRTILETIRDPLTHMVRNAIDHGIEEPDVRRARGKSAAGRLRLRAYHESGQVNIEIADDGGGIDTEGVTRRAVDAGLITREHAARLNDRELLDLIFLPGLSTSETVTNISGRGVGMDVVRTNIERIGGTVDIVNRPGLGATFKVKIPLTLAIVPALVVTTRGDRYAIPQVNLLELVRLEGDQIKQAIEHVWGAPIYRLRGQLLPLVYLDRALGLGDPSAAAGVANIVVLQADGRRFGLVVDGVSDTEEIVVKPLGKLLKNLPLFAGATIMGDGRVALILDVPGVAQQAGLSAEQVERLQSDGDAAAAAAARGSGDERRSFLLFRHAGGRRLAVPLSQVARLEEIPAASVEWAADREVVQYRGRILPLLRLDGHSFRGDEEESRRDPMHVIVSASRGGSVGLVVDEILDVVDGAPRVQRAGRGGMAGTAVIQDRVTEMLDLDRLVRDNDPAPFDPEEAAATAG